MRAWCFILLSCFASVAFSASEFIPKDKIITELAVYDDLAVVRFSPGFQNSQGCTSNSQNLIQLNFDDNTGDNTALLSTLLAAAAGGKKVGFGISGCTGQYPEIYRVNVQY